MVNFHLGKFCLIVLTSGCVYFKVFKAIIGEVNLKISYSRVFSNYYSHDEGWVSSLHDMGMEVIFNEIML